MRIHRFVTGLLLLPIVVFLLSFTSNQDLLIYRKHKLDLCQIDNNAFREGEVMAYTIFYNLNFIWIPAGEVVFRVIDKGDKYHLVGTGQTYPSYEWFYKVRDYYESYIDKETLLPHRSLRDVQEGKFEYYDYMQFDQQANRVTFKAGKKKDTLKVESMDLESCMHDILSIFYYMRNVEFSRYEEGDALEFKVFMEKKVWDLDVEYIGQEKLRIKGMGKQNVVIFSPETIAGTVFKEGDRMKVFVSDDENRVPLLIESPVSVGSIKAVLQHHSGLRNDKISYVR